MSHCRHLLQSAIIAAFMIVFAMTQLYAKEFTIVLDAGHGGKDYGAIGKTAREKDINLGVALKLGELIGKEMKDVNLVYTRDNDTFVTLQGRADIANKAGGDLFISIHTNSVDAKSPRRTTVSGASVYTLGLKRFEENLNVAKQENAVMMLEADYSTTYQGFDPNSTESYIMFELSRDIHMDHSIKAADAIQSELVSTAGRKDHGIRQAIFWVLVQTSMPAVLVELDFICNPTCEKYLSSETGQKQLARAIFNGIKSYKACCDKESQVIGKTPPKSSGDKMPVKKNKKPAKASQEANTQEINSQNVNTPEKKQKSITAKSDPQPSGEVIYKVQFMTSGSMLPEGSPKFKGLSPTDSYLEGGVVKYTYGASVSQDEAKRLLAKVKPLFKDAFIIKTIDGKRVK